MIRKPNANRGLGGITKIAKQIDTEIKRFDTAMDEEAAKRIRKRLKFEKLEQRVFKALFDVTQAVNKAVEKKRNAIDAQVLASMNAEAEYVREEERLVSAREKVETLL